MILDICQIARLFDSSPFFYYTNFTSKQNYQNMSIILNKLKKETIIYCPLCNKEYCPVSLQVVDQAAETILAHSNCPACEGSILSLLYKDFLGITLLGLVTDMNYEDALKLKNAEAVDSDEVLSLFEQLSH
jgi:hypothetical protein